MTTTALPIRHNWMYRRIVLPILALLRMGASPRRLAWSIAVGLLIGINPMIGTTTLLCLAVAFVFRLNVAASQLANHVVYPIQLLLVIPFLQLGTRLFHTAALPFSARTLFADVRSHPLELARRLWLWEWHALVLWTALAVVMVPLLAMALTPMLRGLLVRVEEHRYPLVPKL